MVYTGLMRVYLKARPVLVGSLCRIENWCDVKEVEGLLKEKKVRPSASPSLSRWVTEWGGGLEIQRFDRSLSREKDA